MASILDELQRLGISTRAPVVPEPVVEAAVSTASEPLVVEDQDILQAEVQTPQEPEVIAIATPEPGSVEPRSNVSDAAAEKILKLLGNMYDKLSEASVTMAAVAGHVKELHEALSAPLGAPLTERTDDAPVSG